MQNGTGTLEDKFLTKLNMVLSYKLTNVLLGTYPTDWKTYLLIKNLHKNFYSNTIHNHQKLKSTKTSFNRKCIDKHFHTMECCSAINRNECLGMNKHGKF